MARRDFGSVRSSGDSKDATNAANRDSKDPSNAASDGSNDASNAADLAKALIEEAINQADKISEIIVGQAESVGGQAWAAAPSKVKKDVDEAGQTVTGDPSYRFGDSTRKNLDKIKDQAQEGIAQMGDASSEVLDKLREYDFSKITDWSLPKSEWGKELTTQVEGLGRSVTGNPEYKLGDYTRAISAQITSATDRETQRLALPATSPELRQIVLEQQILLKSLAGQPGCREEDEELLTLNGDVEELKELVMEQQGVIDAIGVASKN